MSRLTCDGDVLLVLDDSASAADYVDDGAFFLFRRQWMFKRQNSFAFYLNAANLKQKYMDEVRDQKTERK
jgi:hypothetical protein